MPRICKNTNGFTLAEVLVVSAIIAILAVVAIPIYTGYVKGQRLKAVEGLAQTVAVSANAYYRRYGAPMHINQLNIYLPNTSEYSITISGTNVIVTYVLDNTITRTVPFN